MAEFFYNTLSSMLGSSLIEDCSSWMASVIAALNTIFSNNTLNNAYTIFIALACSLATVYLYMDLISNATREMITLERLITTLIKYFIVMIILIYLEDIIKTLFNVMYGIYNISAEQFDPSTTTDITYFGYDRWPTWGEVKEQFEDYFGFFTSEMLQNIGLFFQMLIPYIICFIAKFASMFISTSNAVMLIVRALFAPFGVVQCFEEGQRSAGIRYLKNFAAEALSFAVVVGVLYASSMLSTYLTASTLSSSPFNNEITLENIRELVSNSYVFRVIIIQVTAIGAMMQGTRIAKDIVGVQ